MTQPLAYPDLSLPVFSDKPLNIAALLKRAGLEINRGSAAIAHHPLNYQIEVSAKKSGTVIQSIPQQASFDEKLFDSLVQLKVAVSQYAMHLPADERHRIFERLDSVINLDDWHEEDKLPRLESFRDFLKWMIYAKHFQWSSIGVSDEGNILVVWITPDVTLTANFAGQNKVAWTATIETATPRDHAVGTYSLQNFAKQALFYLGGGATGEIGQHS